VRYVDAKGRPFVNLPVTQTWQNSSAESSANEHTKETDQNGYVVFPTRKVWAPLLVRIFRPIANILSSGINASFGSSSWLNNMCNLTEAGDSTVYDENEVVGTVVLVFYEKYIPNLPDAFPVRSHSQCVVIEAQAKDATIK
jgi:hypothetical protein